MVMANAGRTGNWRRRVVKGIRSVSEGVMLSRGMNTRCHLCFNDMLHELNDNEPGTIS